jgi:hypothetical protein
LGSWCSAGVKKGYALVAFSTQIGRETGAVYSRGLAKVKTVTALQLLDPKRRYQVFQFLRAANLNNLNGRCTIENDLSEDWNPTMLEIVDE